MKTSIITALISSRQNGQLQVGRPPSHFDAAYYVTALAIYMTFRARSKQMVHTMRSCASFAMRFAEETFGGGLFPSSSPNYYLVVNGQDCAVTLKVVFLCS
jgi:hypothetical protein